MTTWQSGPGTGYNQGPPGPGFILPDTHGQGPPPGLGVPPGYPSYGQGPPPPGSIPYGEPQQPGMYGSLYQGTSGNVDDPMQYDGEVKGFGFSDKTIRNGFIRKVYSILMCQLLITVSMIALFLYDESVQLWVKKHPAMVWICLGVTLVLMICMACCESVRRKAPMNFIFLSIFTIAESFLVAFISATYEFEEVLFAVGITTTICLGLTIFAFQTKWDFTGWSSYLFVALLVLLIFGILTIFIPGKIIKLVYACLGAFIFSLYLIFDTQLMIGGEHKCSISPEEYIFAALNLISTL